MNKDKCDQPIAINIDCKRILKAILKSQKETSMAIKQMTERFDTRVTYVDALRDGFMCLENRILLLENSLADLLRERDHIKKTIPDNGEEYTET